MNNIKTVSEGVDALLKYMEKTVDAKWEFIPATGDELVDTLVVDGVKYPLFWWRYDNTLFPLVEGTTGFDIVSSKQNLVTTKSFGLDRAIIKEFDIAEWVLDSEIAKLNCFKKGTSAEILITMKNEKVAILELAATLADGTVEQGRHTVWGRNGMASDRVVSQKDTPQALYLYSDNSTTPKTYNDVFFELYGLGREDVVRSSAILAILLGEEDPKPWIAKYEKYKELLKKAYKSSQEHEPYVVK